jgi:hypothetical protein
MPFTLSNAGAAAAIDFLLKKNGAGIDPAPCSFAC